MTLSEWINEAALRLKAVGIESSRLEAQLLAASAYGQTRAWLIVHAEEAIEHQERLDWLLARRLEREPLSYILGHREFYGRRFLVSEAVLIPRQETETVVEEAMSWIRPGDWVLDIGTGSGIIAITLAQETLALVGASDISAEALFVAARNADLLGAQVGFTLGDLTTVFANNAFDVVVSNPPYIGVDEVLEPEVGSYEPHLALYAADSGVSLYKRLAKEGKAITKRTMIVEAADGRADTVRDIFEAEQWTFARSRIDLLGHERALAFNPPC